MAELKREMGEISRNSEFFSISELEMQTGQPVANFASVALKELVDNGIDSAESQDLSEIDLDVTINENVVRISVQDNGPGLKSKTIDRITDFDVRVIDKLNYRSPSRGQQGNALKTILGMPYALGCKEPVVITSHGVEHTIYASPDPLGQVNIAHDKKKTASVKGTTVALTLPRIPVAFRFNPGWWARAYALANPHVLAKIRCFDERTQVGYQ